MLTARQALRLAQKLMDRWDRSAARSLKAETNWSWLEQRFDRLRHVRDRLALAHTKGLRLAETILAEELIRAAAPMARFLDGLDRERPPDTRPNLADWLAEIRQLESEFDEFKILWRESVLRVETEPITLEGVELGPFAIELSWNGDEDRSARSVLRCVALEPNPASGRDDVPHPHVSGESVCLGDATIPFERAITAGRIADAFVIVRSVLTNYNPASPYVSLDEWDGYSCSDCGDAGQHDERCTCEACGDDLCSSCCYYCTSCSIGCCGSCIGSCDRCESSCCSGCLLPFDRRMVCRSCTTPCAVCGERRPKDEFDDDRICSDCQSSEDSTDDDDATDDVDQITVANA